MPTASQQRGKTPPSTSVLDMILNHLMVRLQSWSFGESGVLQGPLLVRVDLEVFSRVPSMGQIEEFNHLIECKQITDVKLNC